MDVSEIDSAVIEVEARMDEIKRHLVEMTRKRNGTSFGFPQNVLSEFEYILGFEERSARSASQHQTTAVWCPFNQMDMQIDTMIAPLIQEIWRVGWQTVNSCQNNNPEDYIWIEFRYSHELGEFLNAIFRGEMADLDIVSRSQQYRFIPNSWKYDTGVFGRVESDNHPDYDYDSEYEEEPIESFDVSVSLRFPQSDLSFVYDKLVKYNH